MKTTWIMTLTGLLLLTALSTQILATVSDSPHGDDVHGRLFRSEDAGRTWRPPAAGFPESTPDNIDPHCVAFDARGQA